MDTEEKSRSGIFYKLGKAVLPILIVGAGVGTGYYLMSTRPVAERRAPQPQVIRVDVTAVRRGVNTVVIPAMGTVKPSRTVELSSQVSGRIIDISDKFVPGGRFEKGEKILQIDPADYKLLVQQRNSDLQTAQADLRLEQGQQAIARHGYELLGETFTDEDEEFVLRIPQMLSREAAVGVAQSRLEQAKIDLARTTVVAPFNCMIQERYVDTGSSVNVGGRLTSIIGTDEYWAELSIPMDVLEWLVIPYNQDQKGSLVKVFTSDIDDGQDYRIGEITGLRADIEESSRMARILVSIKHPLKTDIDGKRLLPLLVGSFVKVEIEGIALENSVKLLRNSVRDGNTILIHGSDGRLVIREVAAAHKDSGYVYFTEGIDDGELVITSDIAAPIASMRLEIAERVDQ